MISNKDLPRFSSYVEANIAAGVDAVNVFKMAARSFKQYETALLTVSSELESGRGLADALADVELLSLIAIEQIRVGEQTGELSLVFESMGAMAEEQNEIAAQIKSVLTMPSAVIVCAVMVTLYVMAHVIPSLASSYNQSGGIIGICITLNSVFKGNEYLYVVIFVFLISTVVFLFKSSIARTAITNAFSGLSFTQNYFFGIWASFMSISLKSGINIDNAVQMCRPTLPTKYAHAVDSVFNEVLEGAAYSDVLNEQEFSDNDIRYLIPEMIRVYILMGSNTGNMDDSLKDAAKRLLKQFRQDAQTATKVTQILSPVIVAVPVCMVMYVFFDILSKGMATL